MAAPKMVRPFKVHAAFEPAGDQPEAIAALAEGIEAGERYQTLLGITGYGFAPLRLPADLDFAPMFHGVDERVPVDALQFGARVLGRLIATC